MKFIRFASLLGLLLAASACFAQMYMITDLGTLGGSYGEAWGINASGQVVGDSRTSNGTAHAFRTAPSQPINPATDDLGTLGGVDSSARGINDSGQVAGYSTTSSGQWHAFRTAPNLPINSSTDDLGTLGGAESQAFGINASGQVVGYSIGSSGQWWHAFRTAPNKAINPATDDLQAGIWSYAYAINDSGQAIGWTTFAGIGDHAFRTGANASINPASDDLGTLGGAWSRATAINASGQVVGYSITGPAWIVHAYRTAPNQAINPASDDLGILDDTSSEAHGINNFGQVVGWTGTTSFLYSNGAMHDLNKFIPAGSWRVVYASGINDAGQIAGTGIMGSERHPLLLTPIYKAFVQPPLNARGKSFFSANRGVVPVKFSLTEYGAPSCHLLPATIDVFQAAASSAVISGNFRIDPAACQYIYNLKASSLVVGTYRVDISINGIMVGHAVFALK